MIGNFDITFLDRENERIEADVLGLLEEIEEIDDEYQEASENRREG